MKQTADNASRDAYLASASGTGVEVRIFRTMTTVVILAAIVSFAFAPWRVTAGLFVGGLLSLLNYHWLRRSISAVFNFTLAGARPRISLAQYVLRYFAVGMVVFLACQFNLVSLPATITGLCSFVIALFVEALREFYFAIIHREEIT